VARQVLGLIAALAFCVGGALAAGEPERDLKTPQTPWGRLAPDDRRVLAPLQSEWDTLPGYQQQRLQSAARQYPKMQPTQRERHMRRFKSVAQGQRFPAVHDAVHNLFTVGRHQLRAGHQRLLRSRAFVAWNSVAAAWPFFS